MFFISEKKSNMITSVTIKKNLNHFKVTKTTEAQTSGPESLSVERTITPESATPPAQATPPECPTPVATSGQMTASSEETPAETIAVTDPPKNSRYGIFLFS